MPTPLSILAHPEQRAEELTERDLTGSIRKAIKALLVLAEAGQQWEVLAQELGACCRARQERRSEDGGSERRSLTRRFEHALAKVRGNSCRAAIQVLLGPGALPPSAATAKATLDLFRLELFERDDSYARPADRNLPHVSFKVDAVADRVHKVKTAAQPGASRTRPGHLKCLLLVSGGAAALHQWVRRFSNCQLHPLILVPFLHYLARPLDKGGGKVRPIVLGVLLVKLAPGCLVDVHKSKLDKLFTGREDGDEPDAFRQGLFIQLGFTQCDGVSQMLEHARFLASANPHRVLIALDVKNVFGEMSKAWRRRAVARDMPTMERGLAQLWSWDHVLNVERKPGEWESHAVADGLWQGSCEATAVFCVGFRHALARFLEKAAAKGIRVAEIYGRRVLERVP